MNLNKFMANANLTTKLRSSGEASINAKALKAANLTVDAMAQRLVSMWLELNEHYTGVGYSWYADAHNFASVIADMYGISVWQSAQVISALSPQNPWDGRRNKAGERISDGNRICALRVVDAFFSGDESAVNQLSGWGYAGDFLAKAIKALRNEEIDWSTAPKTHRFALLIANPNREDIVVVDSHASRIATGNLGGKYHVVEKTGYKLIEAAYVKAAKALGIPGYVLQAGLWQVAADGLLYSVKDEE